jgi:hypothetical protein
MTRPVVTVRADTPLDEGYLNDGKASGAAGCPWSTKAVAAPASSRKPILPPKHRRRAPPNWFAKFPAAETNEAKPEGLEV